MKNVYLIFIIGSIVIISFYQVVWAEEYRDPFYREEKIDCDESSETLLSLLQKWQFKGVIQLHNDSYQKIWLTSNDHWLTAAIGLIPNELLPWQIKRITLDNVIWETHLTGNCEQSILWTMQLNGKE